MANIFQAAIILTAVDKMTAVINRATRNGEDRLQALSNKAARMSGVGMGLVGAGAGAAALLTPAISAYRELESSSASLQSQMLEAGGTTSKYFQGLNDLAVQLGNKLPGTTADMQGMFETLLSNNTEAIDILNGVGKSAAYASIALKMPYVEGAKFAAQLKVATGVASDDMEKFMDVIVRTRALGIDPTEMSYAFGRSGLKQFGIGGLEDAKAMSALFSTIIPITKSGETTGSGLSRLITAVFDKDKMKEANAELSKYGISWKFIDEATGKFMGVENLVGQLGKLSTLNDSQRLNILQGIFGEGEDRKIAAIIAANGVKGYNEAVNRMASQGTLEQKVAIQAGTLNSIWEASTGTIQNMFAGMGAAIAPELKAISGYIGSAAANMQRLAAQYPNVFKFVGLFTAGVSVLLTIMGVVKMVQAAFVMLNVVLLANPLILIGVGLVAAVALIYTYWGPISGFFTRIWNGIGAGFKALGLDKLFTAIWKVVSGTFKLIWAVVTNFTPLGLLIQHWDKVVKAFGAVWKAIKAQFTAWWNFFMGLGKLFFNAGANIINSIIEGITSKINLVGSIIGKVTQKIRNFFPFSPAKEGALKDIHKVRLIETIAASIKPGPMVAAVRNTTSAVFAEANRPGLSTKAGGGNTGGGISINYAPVIHTNGSGEDFSALLSKHKDEILKLVQQATNRRASIAF